jgi:hypothetical protein
MEKQARHHLTLVVIWIQTCLKIALEEFRGTPDCSRALYRPVVRTLYRVMGCWQSR